MVKEKLSKSNAEPFLIRAGLFQHIEPQVLIDIAAKCKQTSIPSGQDLFVQGDPALSFFFIIDGWIKLYRLSRDGQEAVINVFGPGETFAEAAVFGPLQRYPVSAQAVEDTTLLEIPRIFFVEKIKENSDFALSILGSISARQRFLIQQIEQLTIREAPQRLGTFLLRLCPVDNNEELKINLPYDKSLIAKRLNIQPETFSRAIKKLEMHGVKTKGRDIFIHDIKKLAAFCDIDDRNSLC